MTTTNLKLMIPGPVQPEDAVMDAMGAPVRPHYGPEFRDSYNETTGLLKKVFNTQGDVFLLVGSGSSAIDACIGSLVPSGKKMIIGINGFFGLRLKEIAEGYNIEVLPVVAEWGKPLEPEDIDAALGEHTDVSAVAVVHLETSTTIINPAQEIGRVTRRHGVPFILDAVSSLGGMPVYMDDWGVDLCAAATQKCLGAPPGLAPVAVSEAGWTALNRNPQTGHGWYLNLNIWKRYARDWADWHPFPITMTSNNLFALKTSLESLLAEGIEVRMERYRTLALRLRAGLRRIGMPPFTPDELLAPVLTSAYGPEGVPTGDIVQYMADIYGIKIAGGLGEQLKDKVFRIGHMAPTVSEADIDEVIDALASFKPDWNISK